MADHFIDWDNQTRKKVPDQGHNRWFYRKWEDHDTLSPYPCRNDRQGRKADQLAPSQGNTLP